MALGPMTATQAAEHAAAHQSKVMNGRRIPKLTKLEARLSEETCVWIYNVGPWSHRQFVPSLGQFVIPKCEEGQDYAVIPNPLPGVYTETVPIDERHYELRREEGNNGTEGGEYIANQIIGVGQHLSPSNSFVPMGVFIGEQRGYRKVKGDASVFAPIPTDEELLRATTLLENYYMKLVNEAKRAFEEGPKAAEAVIRDQHRLAARKLKLDNEAWMQRTVTSGRQKCLMCGTIVDSDVVMCPNHPNTPYIFDRAKYNEIMAMNSLPVFGASK